MAVTTSSLLALQLLCLFGISLTTAARNSDRYEGAQVLTIDYTPRVKNLIRQRGLDVWGSNGSFVDVMVPGEVVDSVKIEVSSFTVPFAVKIPNLKEAIDKQNTPTEAVSRASGDSPISFDSFQRLGAIYDYLDYLAHKYPEIASVGVMGYTSENRELKYIKISSGKRNAKAVFIDGGVHAREWASPASVTYIIRELVERRSNLPREMLELDFYILPVLNPDGYEYTHTAERMWRKNRSGSGRCRGADINRNFDFYFGGQGTSGYPCDEIYRGKSANSELETQALTKFLLNLRGNLKAYITFHSYGQYILVPYGYRNNAFAPDFDEMERVGRLAATAMRNAGGADYTVGNTANTLYPAAGGSDDWTKAKIGVKYAYCIELRDNGRYGFVLPASQIIPTAKEAFEAVKVIASAAYRA